MQPDYPLYEEMVRRNSRGRWFWRAGAWLCYAGIIGLCLVFVVWPMMFFSNFAGWGIVFALTALVMAGLYTLGSFLKRVSYRIALGEGIDITQFIESSGPEKR